MNEFDRRWKQAVDMARSPQVPLPEEAPFGFVERVLNHREAAAEPAFAVLWQAVALRTLGTMTIALLLLLTYEEISARPDDLSRPELESAVVDSISLP
jgi:hypothetical protein